MKVFDFVFGGLARWLLGALMLVGIAINFANVIARYVFDSAIFWTEEVLVFITIWGVFIGVAAIAYRGDHLNMDLVSARIRGRARTALNAVILLALLFCCVFMVVQSYTVVSLFLQAGQVSVAARIPKYLPHAALLVGFALTAIAVIVRARAYLRGKF